MCECVCVQILITKKVACFVAAAALLCALGVGNRVDVYDDLVS